MPLPLKDSADQAVSYNLYRSEGARAVYHGPIHNDLKTDEVIIQATEPKKTSQSFGNRRSVAKLIRTTLADIPNSSDEQTRDMKAELSVSLPVGAQESDIAELVAGIRALVNTDEIMVELAQSGKIQF